MTFVYSLVLASISILIAHLGVDGRFYWLKVIYLLFFITLIPGSALLKAIDLRFNKLSEWLMTSISSSLFLLYPASIIVVLIEGQGKSSVYQKHITHSFVALAVVIAICVVIYVVRKNFLSSTENALGLKQKIESDFKKIEIVFLTVIIFIFCSLVLNNLGRADVLLDEYDISYQAYDLIDGIFDGRKSFLLSFNTHPPLIMNISHYILNIINPNGLDTLLDWQYRIPEVIIGVLILLTTYIISRDFFGSKAATIATVLLAINNYHVWYSRFVEREIFLSFFMIAFVYALKKIVIDRRDNFVFLAGMSLGAALLVKASGLILLLLLGVIVFLTKNYLLIHKWNIFKIVNLALVIYSPVIIFNMTAYFVYGYADSLFSRFLPGAIGFGATTIIPNSWLVNPVVILKLLIDVYSVPIFLLFVVSIIFSLTLHPSIKIKVLIFWICFSYLFFIPTVVRAYYLHFITIPIVIITGYLLSTVKNKVLLSVVFIPTIAWSYIYSYKTNVDASYSLPGNYRDVGSTGSKIEYPILYSRFSLAARSWVEDDGWKDLVNFLNNEKESFCLRFSDELDSIALRRYFWYKDEIKKFFKGSYGITRFPVCDGNNNVTSYFVTINKLDVLRYPIIIHNSAGAEKFYVYKNI